MKYNIRGDKMLITDAIKDYTGKSYTPMQADAYKNIRDKLYFSLFI